MKLEYKSHVGGMFKMVLSLNVAIASIDDGSMMPRT